MLSMVTDYRTSTGCPREDLERIATAGFSHVHWCHHWDDDFLYAGCEIEQIRRWLAEFSLTLLDLHASAGREKAWGSALEHERLGGVELIVNRIEMAAALEADAIVLHLPPVDGDRPVGEPLRDRMRRSLDALRPVAARRGVRIAIENGEFDRIEQVLTEYGPEFVGLCYDSGHGNMVPDGLERLEALKDRLICIHLHDNDGVSDQHRLPFAGTLDWQRLAGIVAGSAYAKCVSLECTLAHGEIEDPQAFLAEAFERAGRLAGMIETCRTG